MRFPLGLTASMTEYITRKRLAGEQYVPLVLMLEPLFACNLTCSTCGRIREYEGKTNLMMDLDECLDASRECGAPIVSVCGGEPLIYPQIGELIDGLIAMKRYVYLCTNGTLLAESIGKLKPSKRLLLNVHIDGPAEVHDKIVEKAGAFDAAITGMKRAASKGFQLTVNTTVCKDTDLNQIDHLMTRLEKIGVQSFMISPAFSYEAVDDKGCFLSRADVHEKFRGIDRIAQRHRLSDTPIYLEYLKGERELKCTAWGNPTRNVMGWRSPCYLIADEHFGSYKSLMAGTDWDAYGVGREPRCKDCMAHCGFEATAALMLNKRQGDLWKMIRWQLK